MGEERRTGGVGGLSGAEIVWVGVAPQLRPPGSAGPRGRPAAPGGVRDLSAGAACGPLAKRSQAPAGYGAQESEQQVWLWRGRAEGPQDHSVNQTPAVAAPLQLPGPRDSGLRAGCFLSSDEWVTAAYPKTRREGRPGRVRGAAEPQLIQSLMLSSKAVRTGGIRQTSFQLLLPPLPAVWAPPLPGLNFPFCLA